MDEHEVRGKLPERYALALCLRDLGYGYDRIAALVAVDEAAVAALLEIAERKELAIRGKP